MDYNNMLFGSTLRSILEERRIRQNEFAIKIGVSTNTVQSWVQGKRAPGLKNLVDMSSFLNISIDTLAGLKSLNVSSVNNDTPTYGNVNKQLKDCEVLRRENELLNKLNEMQELLIKQLTTN